MITIDNNLLKGKKFIDLFAGLGGFRLALQSLGAKCVFSSEWEPSVAEVYYNNFGEAPHGDITKIDASVIPDHDILCAGFPCQAFSISGKKLGFEDSRGTLFFDVARIIKEKKPSVVFMENVKNFATHDNGQTLQVVQSIMKALGYTFFYKVLNAANYGIPQKRERIYIVCFKNNLNINMFNFPTSMTLTTYLEDFLLDEKDIPPELYVEREDVYMANIIDDTYKDRPIRLGIVNKGGQGERIYSTKGVAITFSSNGGGVFAKTGGYMIGGKYRRLHPAECARLMGFPDNYKICENRNKAYQHFGNSVIIDVLQYIAMEFGQQLVTAENKDKISYEKLRLMA